MYIKLISFHRQNQQPPTLHPAFPVTYQCEINPGWISISTAKYRWSNVFQTISGSSFSDWIADGVQDVSVLSYTCNQQCVHFRNAS